MITEKETSISSPINVQGKKLYTMKTFFSNYNVVSSHMIDWLHLLEELAEGYCEQNVAQVSQFFVIEKTIITPKI